MFYKNFKYLDLDLSNQKSGRFIIKKGPGRFMITVLIKLMIVFKLNCTYVAKFLKE